MTAPDLDALICAIRNYRQADSDGIVVFVSREACDKAAAALAELREDNARLRHPTAMDEAIAAGDGTLHGAIDHWQQLSDALQADNERLAKRGQKYRDDWERAEAEAERLEQAILDQAELNRRRITALSDAEALARGKIAEQMIEIVRLTKLKAECWSNPEAWMKWCDIRVLERAEDANKDRNAAVTQWTVEKLKCERAEAEVARLQDDTAEIDRLRGENARLLSDPMNVGWQRAQDAIKDRAAAVSQWKAVNQRIAALEAERDALKQDALRYRWLREKLVYQKSGPHYGWTLDELIPGDERDAAIDAARSKP